MNKPEPTGDERVAAKLGLHPERVAQIRAHFNDSADGVIVREIQADRLQQQLDEQQRLYATVEPEGLRALQGRCNALKTAIDTIQNRIQ